MVIVKERGSVSQQRLAINGAALDLQAVYDDCKTHPSSYDRRRCHFIGKIPDSRWGTYNMEAEASPNEIIIFDIHAKKPYFKASIHQEGDKRVLSFEVFLKYPDGKYMSGFPSGSQLTRSALEFFEKNGKPVDAVDALWLEGEGSDNYNAVQDARRLNPGLSLDEAVKEAWSYKNNVGNLGFKKVGKPVEDTDHGTPCIRMRFEK